MTTHSVAPIEGDKIVRLEILGLALINPKDPMRGDLEWVGIDVFDQRKTRIYFDREPMENLYDNPVKLKKMLSKLKATDERYGKRVSFSKRVVTFDMSKLYEGKGRITKIYPSRVDVEEIGGKERQGYVYFSPSNLEYMDSEDFILTPDEVVLR